VFVDFWKYDRDIKAAGHESCKWRHLSEIELDECVLQCIKDGCFEEVKE
jgi:hypothetical protein